MGEERERERERESWLPHPSLLCIARLSWFGLKVKLSELSGWGVLVHLSFTISLSFLSPLSLSLVQGEQAKMAK